MNLMHHSPLFWTVMVVFATFYGIRGVVIQLGSAREINHARSKAAQPPLRRHEIAIVLCVPDFAFNFVPTCAGFLALSALRRMLSTARDISQMSTGTAVLLVFLALLAMTGISGKLPELIHRGQFTMYKP